MFILFEKWSNCSQTKNDKNFKLRKIGLDSKEPVMLPQSLEKLKIMANPCTDETNTIVKSAFNPFNICLDNISVNKTNTGRQFQCDEEKESKSEMDRPNESNLHCTKSNKALKAKQRKYSKLLRKPVLKFLELSYLETTATTTSATTTTTTAAAAATKTNHSRTDTSESCIHCNKQKSCEQIDNTSDHNTMHQQRNLIDFKSLVDDCANLTLSPTFLTKAKCSRHHQATPLLRQSLSMVDLNSALTQQSTDVDNSAVPNTSCSQQALINPTNCDVTIDELASYFETFVYIPKKMSSMAEMMYI